MISRIFLCSWSTWTPCCPARRRCCVCEETCADWESNKSILRRRAQKWTAVYRPSNHDMQQLLETLSGHRAVQYAHLRDNSLLLHNRRWVEPEEHLGHDGTEQRHPGMIIFKVCISKQLVGLESCLWEFLFNRLGPVFVNSIKRKGNSALRPQWKNHSPFEENVK